MSECPPKRRWYQIEQRNLRIAGGWAGAFIGCLLVIASLSQGSVPSPQTPGQTQLAVILVSLLVISPLAAIGSLFGRPWLGVLAGVAILGAGVAYVLAVLASGYY